MSKEMETGKMGARALARRAKEASFALAALPGDVRRRALKAVAKALKDREQEIKAANERDLEAARRDGLQAPALNSTRRSCAMSAWAWKRLRRWRIPSAASRCVPSWRRAWCSRGWRAPSA